MDFTASEVSSYSLYFQFTDLEVFKFPRKVGYLGDSVS